MRRGEVRRVRSRRGNGRVGTPIAGCIRKARQTNLARMARDAARLSSQQWPPHPPVRQSTRPKAGLAGCASPLGGGAGLVERAAAWRGGVRGRGRQECGHPLDCDYYWDIIQRQRTLRAEGLLVRPSRRVC
eukprot:scaffold10200_cov122-Isochrysis_galbana.AAC.3